MSSRYNITVKRNEYRGYPTARLQISVGQHYHEGEKLEAVVSWVSRHFNKAVVNLCDSLQRHNLNYRQIPNAHGRAVDLGDEWLKRNGAIIARLPDLDITRWDDWRSTTTYHEALATTMALYNIDNSPLKDIVETMAHTFLTRQNPPISSEKQEEFLRASRLYILEETAVTQVMSAPHIAEIYPGTFPQTIEYIKSRGLNAPQSMTTLGFKRKKLQVA